MNRQPLAFVTYNLLAYPSRTYHVFEVLGDLDSRIDNHGLSRNPSS